MTRGLVSPDVIGRDMERIRHAAAELDHIARIVAESYEEAYEASLSQGRSGEGSGNRRGAALGDPTGDVATSGMHRRMRWRVRQAARLLRRLLPTLEEAESVMVEMFAETDPEMREKLRRLRELEAGLDGSPKVARSAG